MAIGRTIGPGIGHAASYSFPGPIPLGYVPEGEAVGQMVVMYTSTRLQRPGSAFRIQDDVYIPSGDLQLQERLLYTFPGNLQQLTRAKKIYMRGMMIRGNKRVWLFCVNWSRDELWPDAGGDPGPDRVEMDEKKKPGRSFPTAQGIAIILYLLSCPNRAAGQLLDRLGKCAAPSIC